MSTLIPNDLVSDVGNQEISDEQKLKLEKTKNDKKKPNTGKILGGIGLFVAFVLLGIFIYLMVDGNNTNEDATCSAKTCTLPDGSSGKCMDCVLYDVDETTQQNVFARGTLDDYSGSNATNVSLNVDASASQINFIDFADNATVPVDTLSTMEMDSLFDVSQQYKNNDDTKEGNGIMFAIQNLDMSQTLAIVNVTVRNVVYSVFVDPDMGDFVLYLGYYDITNDIWSWAGNLDTASNAYIYDSLDVGVEAVQTEGNEDKIYFFRFVVPQE